LKKRRHSKEGNGFIKKYSTLMAGRCSFFNTVFKRSGSRFWQVTLYPAWKTELKNKCRLKDSVILSLSLPYRLDNLIKKEFIQKIHSRISAPGLLRKLAATACNELVNKLLQSWSVAKAEYLPWAGARSLTETEI
jgi:hypothetical protein